MSNDYLDAYNSKLYKFRVKGIGEKSIRGEFDLPAVIIFMNVLQSLSTDIEYCEKLKEAEFIEIKTDDGQWKKFKIWGDNDKEI